MFKFFEISIIIILICPTNSTNDLCSDCGKFHQFSAVKGRVYNGRASNYGPWTALLRINRSIECSGSIIDYQHVITAGHW